MGGPVAAKSDEGVKPNSTGPDARAAVVAHADYAPDSLSSRLDLEEDRRPAGPFVKIALCFVAGVALGAMTGGLLAWFVIAVGATCAAAWFALKSRMRGVRCWRSQQQLECSY